MKILEGDGMEMSPIMTMLEYIQLKVHFVENYENFFMEI